MNQRVTWVFLTVILSLVFVLILQRATMADEKSQEKQKNEYFESLSDQLRELGDGRSSETQRKRPFSPGSTKSIQTIVRSSLVSKELAKKDDPSVRGVIFRRQGQDFGIRVFAIRSGSVFEAIGLRNGDIIVEVDQRQISSEPDLRAPILQGLQKNDQTQIVLERAGRLVKILAEVGG